MIRKLVPFFLSLVALPLLADADLSLLTEQQPATQYVVNSTASFPVRVMNGGPDVARNVRVTFNVPAETQVRLLPADPCSVQQSAVVCTAGDVLPGATGPAFNVLVTLPAHPATVALTASIASDTPDPRPENNSFTKTLDVVDATVFYFSEPVTPARVDPGATLVVKTVLNNSVPSLPANVHIHYEATNATIEKIDGGSLWSCTIAGTTADCTAPALIEGCRCSGDVNVTLRAAADRAGGTATLKMSATSSLPDLHTLNPERSASVQIYRWIVVTSTADSGGGSLRDAIDQANGGCTTPCKIAFQIPAPVPSSGWFTIAPSTPLPAITADRVFVDGKTQTAFTGDTNSAGPEIALDGRFTTSGHGLEMHSGCDAVVEGLSVGNFADHGLAFFDGGCRNSTFADHRRAAHNYLGVDPTGAAAVPNLRGLMADGVFSATDNVISGNRYSGVWAWRGYQTVDGNRIGTAADGKTPLPNGNSGIFFGPNIQSGEAVGNTISFNGQMGVAVARGANLVDIRTNSMRRNGGLGIDIGIDGPNPPVPDDRLTQPNPPTLLSAVYDPSSKSTVVTLSVRTNFSESYGNVAVVEFFANDGPDGDGEQPTIIQPARNAAGDPFTANIPGDYRGKWINAAVSRVHFIASLPPSTQSIAPTYYAGGDTTTSELSNAVLTQ